MLKKAEKFFGVKRVLAQFASMDVDQSESLKIHVIAKSSIIKHE